MKRQCTQGGYIMILNTLLFIGIITVILVAISNIVVTRYTSSQGFSYSKQSYLTAHSATEEAIYRLKNNMGSASIPTIALGSTSATVSVTDVRGSKEISVDSEASGYVRKLLAHLNLGSGVSFHYGIQAGNGGFVMSGGATVIGNVYSNGDIVATNGVIITGSAIAANGAAIIADQVNESPTTTPNVINFRDTSGTQDFAQSFILSTSSPINKASFYMKKVGNPSDITVRVVADSGDSPSTDEVFSTDGTLSASQVGTTGLGWVDVIFPENPELTVGSKYWIVLDTSKQSSSNYYIIGANSTYTNGSARIGNYGNSWNTTTPTGLDGYFRIYLGGLTSTIGGGSYVGSVNIGTSGIGDAWAHEVKGANVAGSLFCQAGSDNNKACDASHGDPSPQPYPVSEANVQDWKTEAVTASTTNGDVHIDSSNGSIGPMKITGNLLVDGGGTLNIKGTLWVQGSVTVAGGGKIKLDPTYGTNSGVIVADGIVNLGGGGNLSGSGQTGSYLMVLTTSNCPIGIGCGGKNALTLSGGAGAVVLNAQNGNMVLNGGSGVREATAHMITVSGGATITYDSGLVNMNFNSGPSGGYNLLNWLEI